MYFTGSVKVAQAPPAGRHRSELTLMRKTPTTTVPHEFSLVPLSAAGSLRSFGGRFNAGVESSAPSSQSRNSAICCARSAERNASGVSLTSACRR